MAHPLADQQITFLYTRDLAGTDHFYQEVMGLPLKLDQGNCRIYQTSQTSHIGFCQRAEACEEPSAQAMRQVILTFVTPEVDAWYDHLSSKGVGFEEPPSVNADYNIYHCFLRDPDGYLIEIQHFLHPF